MDRLQRDTVLVLLIENLRDRGSWCGETHIQKATYFLQELCGVDLGFDFIMYKHGPYSFDLTGELTSMRADGFLEIVLQQPPYGPSLLPTPHSARLKQLYPRTLGKYACRVQRVAELLGGRGVAELERLATALYVWHEDRSRRESAATRAERMRELKPHISSEDARTAVNTVDDWIAQWAIAEA